MSKYEVVKIITFNTFKELWEAVSPFGEIGKNLSGFVYRGESSNKWALLPASLRKDKGNLWVWKNDIDEYESTQVMREMVLLGEFYRSANEKGLRVPNNEILKHSEDNTKDWLSPEEGAVWHNL